MNTLFKIEVFVDDETGVRPEMDPPHVLALDVDDTRINLYVTTSDPSKQEMEAGAAFLDKLVVAAFDIRSNLLKRLASIDEPTKLRVKR